MPDANTSHSLSKPKKPRPDFPLTPHPSGKWCKKIGGQLHYFGAWARRENGALVRVEGDGWKEAEKEYKEYLDPSSKRANQGKLTVRELANEFLTSKLRKLESEELSERAFRDCKDVTDIMVNTLGANTVVELLKPEDFARLRSAMAKKW